MAETFAASGVDGRVFNVKVLRLGDKYGLKDCLAWGKEKYDNSGENGVEFYDSKYPHTPLGQFVSRYYISTLLESSGGLNLYGGEPVWQIPAGEMDKVRSWLRTVQP